MFKKSFRLRKKADFERVFRQGRPLFFGPIGCRLVKNNLSHLRIGFSFGKKHLRTAVGRNAVRRLLMGRLISLDQAILKKPYDVVFFTVKPLFPGNRQFFASVVENIVEYIGRI